jgi:hypothetical protein
MFFVEISFKKRGNQVFVVECYLNQDSQDIRIFRILAYTAVFSLAEQASSTLYKNVIRGKKLRASVVKKHHARAKKTPRLRG